MASVVGEREVDLTKLSIQDLNSLKGSLEEVSAWAGLVPYATGRHALEM